MGATRPEVHGLLTGMASLVVEHGGSGKMGLHWLRLAGSGAQAPVVVHGLWYSCRLVGVFSARIEPVSPTLTGGFLSPVQPGSPSFVMCFCFHILILLF